LDTPRKNPVAGFPRGIESIRKVLNFKIGVQDLEKVLNLAKNVHKVLKKYGNSKFKTICLFKLCSLPLTTVLPSL